MSDSVRPHQWQPTRLPHPWDSPGKNTGVGCHLRSLISNFSSLIIQLYAIYFPLSSTAWQVGVHGVTKSQDTTEATEHTHTHTHTAAVSPKFGYLGFCSVFFYVIVSQVWPQRATWGRLRKTSLLSSQVPALDAEHTMPCRLHGKASEWSAGRKWEWGESRG